MSGLPPLLEALRGSLHPAEPERLARALGDAERHGLILVLQQRLDASGIALPPHVRDRLRQFRTAMAESGLRNKSLLLRTIDALALAGVVPVLLKGYGFAVRYYVEPLLRPSSDVDILVPRDALRVVEAALSGLGLRRYDDPSAEMEAYHHHIAFSGPAGHVEVHFRPASGLGMKEAEDEALRLESRPAVIDGRQVRLLRPEDEVLYLSVHASQHLFERLNWFYDLELLLQKEPLDWDRVAALTREAKMVPALWATLYVLRLTFGTELPKGARVPQPPGWQRWFVKRVFTAERLVRGDITSHKVRRWLVHAALAAGPVRITRDALGAVKLKSRRMLRRRR